MTVIHIDIPTIGGPRKLKYCTRILQTERFAWFYFEKKQMVKQERRKDYDGH